MKKIKLMPDYDSSPIWELNKYDFFERTKIRNFNT